MQTSLILPTCSTSLLPGVSRGSSFPREYISDLTPVWRRQSGAVILFYFMFCILKFQKHLLTFFQIWIVNDLIQGKLYKNHLLLA